MGFRSQTHVFGLVKQAPLPDEPTYMAYHRGSYLSIILKESLTQVWILFYSFSQMN